MAKCSIITPAEADFIESRAHAMLDVIEDLPEDVKTGPITVYDHEFQSPSDAIWQLYLKRDFAGMHIIINNIRKQATHSNNRPDDIWISSCCRVLSRYLGDIERIVLKPIAIRLHETINAVKTDSLLTLQLHRASIGVDSRRPHRGHTEMDRPHEQSRQGSSQTAPRRTRRLRRNAAGIPRVRP